MRIALIPVKELSQAKRRLAELLDARERAGLAMAMLADVVSACVASDEFDRVTVLSGDLEILERAGEMGADALAEPEGTGGLNPALRFAVQAIIEHHAADEVLILPADIPLVLADDLHAIIDRLAGDKPRVVIVRARDGGTNAMALRPPEVIAPRFGPRSAHAHSSQARSAGVDLAELRLDRVAFDVDSPEAVGELERLAVGPATAAWLAARAIAHP